MAPIARSEASVCEKKVLKKSGGYSNSYDVSQHFNSLNKIWCLSSVGEISGSCFLVRLREESLKKVRRLQQ